MLVSAASASRLSLVRMGFLWPSTEKPGRGAAQEAWMHQVGLFGPSFQTAHGLALRLDRSRILQPVGRDLC